MGTIAVHEFVSLDGVFEDPSWTFEFGFDPRMGETLGAVTGGSTAILLGAYDADAIRRLKDDTDGVIYVSGSGTLVRGLLADGLVDELHLLVYPIAHDVYDNGVVHLVYGPAA